MRHAILQYIYIARDTKSWKHSSESWNIVRMYEVPDDFAIIKLGELALLSTFCSSDPKIQYIPQYPIYPIESTVNSTTLSTLGCVFSVRRSGTFFFCQVGGHVFVKPGLCIVGELPFFGLSQLPSSAYCRCICIPRSFPAFRSEMSRVNTMLGFQTSCVER